MGVSIPNGMEFYQDYSARDIRRVEFQFPTGWNSTFLGASNSPMSPLVSIPNGMEFYFELPPALKRKHYVSIPNGMEFYAALLANSIGSLVFQFPTGWNSTLYLFVLLKI